MPPGFWDKLFDYFTRVDDILRKFNEDYLSGNAKLVDKITDLIEAITGVEPEPDIPRRHIPFYAEGNATGTSTVLLVKADPEQGLGVVGRSGYVQNDSTTEALYIIIDDGSGKSKEITIALSETFVIARDDDVWVDRLILRSRGGAVPYRCLFV